MADLLAGQVSYLEIGSGDVTATRAFFGTVFGWPCHDEAWFQTPAAKAGLHGDDPSPQIYSISTSPTSKPRRRASGQLAARPKSPPPSPGLAASSIAAIQAASDLVFISLQDSAHDFGVLRTKRNVPLSEFRFTRVDPRHARDRNEIWPSVALA